MAYKNMTIEEMLQVSSAFVDPKAPARSVMQQHQLLSGLLPEIEGAHRDVIEVNPEPRNVALQLLAARATELDVVHDTLVRGIYEFCTGASLLVDDGERLLSLRDRLIPEGIGGTILQSYRGQAGYAKLLRERLDAATRAKLREVPVPGGNTLLDCVERWLDAGDRLGQVEDERTHLESNPTEAAKIAAARSRWMRTLNVLTTMAELVPLSDEDDHVVFGPLRDTEAKADRRSARRRAGDVPESEPALPSPSPSPDDTIVG